MRKDIKAGMIIGIAIVAVATITISTRPGQNIQQRQKQSFEEPRPAPTNTVERISLSEPPSDKPPETPPATLPAKTPAVIDTTPKPPEPIYHVVQSGESLYSISEDYYSNPTKWKKIKSANKFISENNTLRPGMKLLIPPDD